MTLWIISRHDNTNIIQQWVDWSLLCTITTTFVNCLLLLNMCQISAYVIGAWSCEIYAGIIVVGMNAWWEVLFPYREAKDVWYCIISASFWKHHERAFKGEIICHLFEWHTITMWSNLLLVRIVTESLLAIYLFGSSHVMKVEWVPWHVPTWPRNIDYSLHD